MQVCEVHLCDFVPLAGHSLLWPVLPCVTAPQSVCPVRCAGGNLRWFSGLVCGTDGCCECSPACLSVHTYFVYFYLCILRSESAASQGCEHVQLSDRFEKSGGLGSFGPGLALG